ncbi:MAG: glycosyltransferase [Lewinellaceae bacterium]|nr:glycosyltransferase [Lewinellaceae bacterium]
MSIFAYVVLGVYSIALLYITLYCVMQFDLLVYYKRGAKRGASEEEEAAAARSRVAKRATAGVAADGSLVDLSPASVYAGADGLEDEEEEEYEWPMVTVQLPLYNEQYVVERLIDTVAAFDYPRDRFEIHVLDDSTDETIDIVRRKVEEYQAKGFQIQQIRRKVRQGYKAGALRDGMEFAKGEFMAIFDADFLPRPDFLRLTIPHFQDGQVGVVQTRWEHINEDYSLITRLQALQLNVHFTVEQVGRMQGDYFLQFNGTAGVWRRQTIEDAGGWEADTLTEDLDLSIRSQIKGWKIKFLEEIGSPAELPAEMNALKGQQFRWMKGGAETARKMLPTLWKSSALTLRQKIHATQHLLGSSVFLFVFITGLSSVPLLFFMDDLIAAGFNKDIFTYFFLGMMSVASVYFVANVQSPARHEPKGEAIVKFFSLFPVFLSLSMGLSLHNSIAVMEGYMGRKSAFVRTPKFNIRTGQDSFNQNKYIIKELSWSTIFEGVLALYYSVAFIYGLTSGINIFLVFHLMLAVGFGTIFYYTVRHLNME